jgi:hypothetical protein
VADIHRGTEGAGSSGASRLPCRVWRRLASQSQPGLGVRDAGGRPGGRLPGGVRSARWVVAGVLVSLTAVAVEVQSAGATAARTEAESVTVSSCWTARTDAAMSGGQGIECDAATPAISLPFTVPTGATSAVVSVYGRCDTNARSGTVSYDGGTASAFPTAGASGCVTSVSQKLLFSVGTSVGSHTLAVSSSVSTAGSGVWLDYYEVTYTPAATTTTVPAVVTYVRLEGDQAQVMYLVSGLVALGVGASVAGLVLRGRS